MFREHGKYLIIHAVIAFELTLRFFPESFFQMSSWDGGKAMAVKENALQQLLELSHHNDSTTWSKVGRVATSLLLILRSSYC